MAINEILKLKQVEHVRNEKKILKVKNNNELVPVSTNISEHQTSILDRAALVQCRPEEPLPVVPLRGWGRALLSPQICREVSPGQREVLLSRDHIRSLLPTHQQHCLQVLTNAAKTG